ncbi:MAG: hypothetical protein JNM36_19635 [Chitinophagales bacterium]|jgi:hypothetical protein|nr:hypothetical protein [Chitinophagales bacterium]
MFSKISSVLALLLIAFLGFVSCQKEAVETTIPVTTDMEGKQLPPNGENAPYHKEITVKGIENSRVYDFTFKISSNNVSLLESFDNSSITFKFLDTNTVNECLSKVSKDETANGTKLNENSFVSPNGNTFVSISLTKIYSPIDLETLPAYDLRLSEKIVDLLRNTKIKTIFNLGEIQLYSKGNSRACNPCTIWNNNKIVKIVGDCGSNFTRTDNYWANTNSNNLFYLNTSIFKCNSVISPCCVSPNIWVRTVFVLQDVVVGLQGLSNTCGFGAWCGPSNNSNCSGVYACY